jgi:hypothetical protein
MITLYLLAVPAYMFRGRGGRVGESAPAGDAVIGARTEKKWFRCLS